MKKKEKMMKKNLKLFKMSRYRVVNVVISEDIIEKLVFIYIIIKYDNIISQIYLFLIVCCWLTCFLTFSLSLPLFEVTFLLWPLTIFAVSAMISCWCSSRMLIYYWCSIVLSLLSCSSICCLSYLIVTIYCSLIFSLLSKASRRFAISSFSCEVYDDDRYLSSFSLRLVLL